MRPSSLLLSASLLVLSASACANTMPYPDAETPVTGSTVQVIAPAAPVYIPDGMVEQIRGAYALSNGWRLKVEKVSRRNIEARIDQQKPMRLRAISEDTFVSANGMVTMRFNQGESGSDMAMSYVPDARLAQVVTISSRVAQR